MYGEALRGERLTGVLGPIEPGTSDGVRRPSACGVSWFGTRGISVIPGVLVIVDAEVSTICSSTVPMVWAVSKRTNGAAGAMPSLRVNARDEAGCEAHLL